MSKFNWGIMAPGSIANKFVEGVQSLDSASVLAAGSRSIKRAKEFCDKHNIERAYGSYEDLLNDKDIDAIYIASPHPFHKDAAIMALNAGKNVLCEKAFTVNSKDLKEVIAVAKEKNLFLMEAFWTRFFPVMIELKKRIKNGDIGEVQRIMADFSFKADEDIEGRWLNPDLAGGALLDIGIYPVNFSYYIMDEKPSEVFSTATLHPETGVDFNESIVFKYKNGAIAHLSSGFCGDGTNSVKIIGSKGSVDIEAMFHTQDKITIEVGGNKEVLSYPHKVNGYEWEALEVERCIKNGLKESEIMPLNESLEILEMLDSLRSEWGVKYPFE